MPELPEVETVVRGLRDTVLGRTISRVRVSAPPSSIVVGKSLKSRSFARLMTGRRIESVERRGKNILMALSGDLTLWVHLKMTGHFYFYENPVPYDKHDLVTFYLEPLQTEKRPPSLRFNDYRRFGRLRLFSNEELWQQDGLKELGPEPLELDAASFVTMCRTRSRMMKPALLDQSFIAGLGNIYADEALHASRIHPKRLTSSLTKRKLEELHAHIQRLLRMAISKMGTSVDTYAGVDGQPGSFQKYLRAYGREGEACAFCGRKIVREKIGSRSAHYCPRCQRL
ncbi:MAG: bifunctional DNA-formamidopyrimidine glycosylase/DNA-(apurinic or apyrimidinic site) lyase [Candidatus Zixiibacteriota bacterium]